VKIKTKRNIVKHNPVAHGGRYSVDNQDPSIVDFSSNITPAGMPTSVKSILKRRLGQMEYYPDSYSSDLISSLKKYTGLAESNLIVGNGSIEIIYNFCSTFLSKKTYFDSCTYIWRI